ncbi:MAG: hypothetical protein ACD_50C00179G0006 [uncultured bacterium]|nr:MAG: hypothetical protein ACD_50C00179G0006 [uncultured bacterium]
MKRLIISSVFIILVAAAMSFTYSYVRNTKFKLETAKVGNGMMLAKGSGILRDMQAKQGKTVQSSENTNRDTSQSWDTYRSEKFGFTMKYPKELRISSEGADLLNGKVKGDLVHFTKATNKGTRGSSITVSFQNVKDGETLDSFVNNSVKGEELMRSVIELGGERAIKVYLRTPLEGSDNIVEDYIYVKKGNAVLIFSSIGEENRPIFEKMVSSVNFI